MADLGIYGLQTEAESFASVTETLLNALEMCHPGVGLRAHAERVAGYAAQLARHLGWAPSQVISCIMVHCYMTSVR